MCLMHSLHFPANDYLDIRRSNDMEDQISDMELVHQAKFTRSDINS